MKIQNYSTGQFYFRDLVKEGLSVNSLSKIHEDPGFSYNQKFKRENDQSTHFHRMFYSLSRNEKFQNIYIKFIKETIKPLMECKEVVYQKIPTFRLHFPGNIAVGEYHRDRNYRDPKWALKVKEMNFFLPITDAYDTNTIWVESEEGKEDFSPIIAEYGQVVMWDGSNLLHGNKTNEEKTTRISFDFRVMDAQNYIPSMKGSINMKSTFAIGGYYEKI